MLEGSQIGTYRVLKRIGEGGMGSVWLAEHTMIGRRAALKVLHAEFSSHPEIVTRFFNEARAATAIADPGIVQIFDFGQHTDGSAYIVMELLDGEPLDNRIARLGVLGITDALRIMRQVASTLGAAHARGIVHRDLKPENIFIVRDPEVAGGERAKVLDFGIAKLSSDQTNVKTQTSAVMGTPTYMSPEQCRGAGHVDQRSDVYSLGCVLFTLVCGRPPFDADGVGELIAMHLREQPPLPSSRRGGVPPEVDRIIMRCLDKDPAHRFGSGADLAVAINSLIGSSPQLAETPGAYGAPTIRLQPTTLSAASGPALVRRSGRSGIYVAAGLAVVIAMGAAAVQLLRNRRREATDAASAGDTPEQVPHQRSWSNESAASAKQYASSREPPAPTLDASTPMKAVLAQFVAWSRVHAGAACPGVADFGPTIHDSWGHPYKLTCTEQPVDQIVGAISAGPDGSFGTADDIKSWELERDVTDTVRGPRWAAAAPSAAGSRSSTKPAAAVPSSKQRATGSTNPPKTAASKRASPTEGIQLDENGLPISR